MISLWRGKDQITEIETRLFTRLFGERILQNDIRGHFVEEMVALAVEPDWRLCSGNWAGWDLEDAIGTRVQIKQSAARQSWPGHPSAGAFSVGMNRGYWLGNEWVPFATPQRVASVYIFAWHGRWDDDANQKDPSQWEFFVLKESQIPATKRRLSLSVLRTLCHPVKHGSLRTALANVRGLAPPANDV